MSEIYNYLCGIRDRLNDPQVLERRKGFSTVQKYTFSDVQESYLLTVPDGAPATLVLITPPQADVETVATSTAFLAVQSRKINPMYAYATRQVITRGKIEKLIQLYEYLK
ncbi:MAG: hypothetical protein ACM3H7_07065 [Acidobacteriaceae bacterium]